MNKDNIKFIMVGVMSLDGFFYNIDLDLKDWRGKNDIKDFVNITKTMGTVLMGVKTALSLPDVKPLGDRNNIVVVDEDEQGASNSLELLRNNGFMLITLKNNELNRETLLERLMHWGINLSSECVAVCGGIKLWKWFLARGVINEVWLHIAPAIMKKQLVSHSYSLFADQSLRETAPKLAYKNWVSYLVEKKE